MIFQNYIYVLRNETNDFILGVHPNFKKAYEFIEELANGKPIIDCGETIQSSVFEIIKDIKCGYFGYVRSEKYTITRRLLTIFPEDQLISITMIDELERENKEQSRNSKYRLRAEII